MNKWLYIINWVTAIFGTVLMMGFVYHSDQQTKLQALDIRILDASGIGFVTSEEIEEMIHNMSYQEQETMLQEINIKRIEKALVDGPFIKNAQVYTTIDGLLCVKLHQRQPLFRVFSASGESHYVDTEGRVMPISATYHPNVPVASGHIPLSYSASVTHDFASDSPTDTTKAFHTMRHLFEVIQYVDQLDDPFWRQMIVQYYLRENGDIAFVQRVGTHQVVLGSSERIAQKLEDLRLLYTEGFSKTGWNQYEEVNIKFENQIICKRKNQ